MLVDDIIIFIYFRCLFTLYSDFETILVPPPPDPPDSAAGADDTTRKRSGSGSGSTSQNTWTDNDLLDLVYEESDCAYLSDTDTLPRRRRHRRPADPDPDPDSDHSDDDDDTASKILNHHQISACSLFCEAPPHLQYLFPPLTFTGEDAGHKYIEELLRVRALIRELYESECNKEMVALTPMEERLHDEVNICHICGSDITCTLTPEEYSDTMASHCFTDDVSQPGGKCFTLETDLLGPKVRWG